MPFERIAGKKVMQPRVHFSPLEGWVVDTAFALTLGEIMACVRYTHLIQGKRAQQSGPEKREEILAALQLLTPETLRQNVLPAPGEKERVVFAERKLR